MRSQQHIVGIIKRDAVVNNWLMSIQPW